MFCFIHDIDHFHENIDVNESHIDVIIVKTWNDERFLDKNVDNSFDNVKF